MEELREQLAESMRRRGELLVTLLKVKTWLELNNRTTSAIYRIVVDAINACG